MIRVPLVTAEVPAKGSRSSGRSRTIGIVARISRMRLRRAAGRMGSVVDGSLDVERIDNGVAFSRMSAVPFLWGDHRAGARRHDGRPDLGRKTPCADAWITARPRSWGWVGVGCEPPHVGGMLPPGHRTRHRPVWCGVVAGGRAGDISVVPRRTAHQRVGTPFVSVVQRIAEWPSTPCGRRSSTSRT